MIEPYTAVGLIPSFWGIRRREDIEKNLESLTKAAFWLSNLDIPVRLIAIPEGALQGFNDEVLDVDHTEFARTCAIDIPGPETDRLGQLARQWGVFIMAQAKARHEDWPDRFFNIGFVIDPDGAVVLKHYKISALLPCERSISPHDVFDWWVEKYGRTLQAFWPVADTAIGRLGIMMAMEGNYPENGRGLALNGAEVVYRASLPAPFTENDFFEISNRARALEVIRLPESHSPSLTANKRGFAPNVIQGNLGKVRPMPQANDGAPRAAIVPVMGRIAAGVPISAIQDHTHNLTVPPEMLGPGEHFALEIKGDSMIEAGIFDGDTVLIRKGDTANNGDIVVALVDDEEATLKRLRRKGDSMSFPSRGERGYRWNESEGRALVRSMESWQPFPDTIPALRRATEAGLRGMGNAVKAVEDSIARNPRSYPEFDNEIWVVAVMHLHRRPGYWRVR